MADHTRAATAETCGVAMEVPLYELYPLLLPVVLRTPTPGAAISTWLFLWEKLATTFLELMAATDMTDEYEAGELKAVLPLLPAAAMLRIP